MKNNESNKVKEVKNIKIKKGWIIETTTNSSDQSMTATKKFFKPIGGGFSKGEITYSVFQSNKKVPTDNIEIDDEL